MTPANLQPLKRFGAAAVVLGTGAAALLLYCFDPVRVPIFPVCQFHRWTGLDCPGCGSLRAMHELLHGHILAALHFNLLLVVSIPVAIWLGYRMVRQHLRGGPLFDIKPAWIWAYAAAWLLFGILRNLPVPILAQFGP
jgi:hypothetical protein